MEEYKFTEVYETVCRYIESDNYKGVSSNQCKSCKDYKFKLDKTDRFASLCYDDKIVYVIYDRPSNIVVYDICNLSSVSSRFNNSINCIKFKENDYQLENLEKFMLGLVIYFSDKLSE